jgi:hypothetical protein
MDPHYLTKHKGRLAMRLTMKLVRLGILSVSVAVLALASPAAARGSSSRIACIEYGFWGPVCYESQNCPSISVGVNVCADEAPPGAVENCNICPFDEHWCDEDCDINEWSWWCFAVEETEECYPQ